MEKVLVVVKTSHLNRSENLLFFGGIAVELQFYPLGHSTNPVFDDFRDRV
jgi:hypothetical protein